MTAKTATITGSRTMHPRHGAHSDISVIIDGEKAGPFAYVPEAALSDILSRVHRSPVDTTKRRADGLYRVILANGAEAKVSRDNAVEGDTGPGKWQWDDEAGGCGNLDTRREAVESFREYRG
jgi:hypothetical protein